ncbi:hypothetical protein [Shewanella aestuarii]|uniref:Hemerythrin-like domain-containing protein n=1 Tax=Shewanella aestuarii TaxID=1028752 RepID=A0A6G9QRI2_9GAMM|nr:hypothetical protein [Shewanella aestuarii]QIR16419.1 hypothetical protein HBH39_18270 [Shewanella aestuarii]
MQGLMTNYFSAIHDKQSFLLSYSYGLIRSNIAQSQHVFNFIKRDLLLFIHWEEEVLFPLFKDEKNPLFESYPTYSLLQEFQHCKMLIEHISLDLSKISTLSQSNNDKAKVEANSTISNLLPIFEELRILLNLLNIKKESIFYPTVDEALTKEEIAELFITIVNHE